MKKLLNISGLALGLILVGLTFMNVNTADAQPNIGVKGGLDFAKLSYSSSGASISSSSTTGFVAGVYTNFEMSSGFMLQPELLYVQKGAESTFSNTTTTTTLDYIEIPVLAKYGFSAGGSSFKPYAAAGPYLGFNVNAESESSGQTTDISDNVKGTDFGVAGEVGANISGFNIGVRYDLGITNIDDSASGSGMGDTTNRALFITAGYSF
ncbi:porin family protein [Fodinibius sp. SL11]|uniref:porin family protein n=1 Tax=Fodinibius sp. SL11 TaxID=3425690 RepID=UPI003F884ADE